MSLYKLLKSKERKKTTDGRNNLKVFLPESEPDIPRTRRFASSLDTPRCGTGTAEIHSDIRPQCTFETAHVSLIGETIAHSAKEALEIRTTKICSGLEFGEGIDLGANGVEVDVGGGVAVELLGEVCVDAKEFRPAGRCRGGCGLCFEGGEECLEPFEGGGVFADPDELDTTETLGWVGSTAQVPDVFEDGGPGSDTDTCSDEDGDFVVEHIFGGSSIWAIDAELGHLLAILKGNFVHAHRVEAVIGFGLRGATAKGVTKGAGEVTNLADVDGDIWIEGARGDSEGVPLLGRDGGNLEEEPLTGFVFHGGFAELNFHCVVWMTDDFGDFGFTGGSDFTVETFN